MALPSEIAHVLSEELERAFYLAGKRILLRYLEDLTEAQVMAAMRSTGKMRQLIDDALREEVAAKYTLSSSSPGRAGSPPSPYAALVPKHRVVILERTRRMVAVLENYLSAADAPTRLPLAQAAKLVKTSMDYAITPGSLRKSITRSREYHRLVIRGKSHPMVQLRSDLLVEMLERRYKLDRLDRTSRVIALARKDRAS